MVRELRSIGAALALALAAPGPAFGAEPRVLVAPPRADVGLAPLARAHRAWLAGRLRQAGVGARAPAELAGNGPGEALELARALGAALVVQADLRERDGAARVALRAHDAETGERVAATLGEGALVELGDASESALRALLPHLGVPAAALPDAPAPSLDELAAAGRALEALDRGELARAWEELEGRLLPMAMELRASLLDAAQRGNASPVERARILAASGDADAAWRLLAPGLDVAGTRPPEPQLLTAAAEVQLARGDAARARQLADAALRARPDDPDALVALAGALARMGDRAGAEVALARASRAAPERARPLERLAALEAELPDGSARHTLALAAFESRGLETVRALRSLERVVARDPGTAAEVARARGLLFARLGRPDEAARAFEQALAHGGSRDPELLAGLGVARERAGASNAEAPLRLALELAPEHPRALRGLAELELARGHPAEAATLLRRAAAAAPEDEATRVALSRAVEASEGPAAALAALVGGAPEPAAEPETLARIASLERSAGRLDAARETLARALDAWPEDAALQALLASASGGVGAPSGSAGPDDAALAGAGLDLDELALAFAAQVPDARRRRIALVGLREPGLREPGGVRAALLRWLHPRAPDLDALGAALERSLGIAFTRVPAAFADPARHAERVARVQAFADADALDAETIAALNEALDTDSLFVAQLRRGLPAVDDPEGALGACAQAGRVEFELRMLSGRHADVASALSDVVCLADGRALAVSWNRRAFPLYAAVGLLLLFPLLRGWGTVVVSIEIPPKTKGFLHVRIGRKPEPTESDKTPRARRRRGHLFRALSALSRYRKDMAGRETVFRWIPARKRSYFVTVRGPLLDAMGNEVIGHFLEEQRVRVERGRVARPVFDFRPRECAVEVTITRGGQPARGARAALRGDPSSLRYPRSGTTYFYLGIGSHTLVVGAGDRAAEKSVAISELARAIPLAFDLDDDAACMVRNCSEAVDPYLAGDFEVAALALEAAGQTVSAHLMRGAHHRQRGENEAAAREFEAAGCLEEAAALRASARDLAGSAALYEQAGDFARAAETHRAAGALEEAGRCYELAYEYGEAIECYLECGAREQALGLQEKTGAYLEAAALARELGDAERALRNLQSVDRRDASWGEACRRMAELLAERGLHDLAAQKAAEAIDAAGGGSATLELEELRAGWLERAGRLREALAALENARRLAPTREDLGPRIAALRGALAAGTAATALAAAPVPHDATGAAAAEARYETLGELGRGGMGVVFKARDRRLGRLVALKRMPDHLRHHPVVAELFLREARSAAALNHPNIVTVYDAGEEGGEYFISMELLEGLPVDRILERRGRFSVADTARIGVQVAAGLHYAHEHRIVHRDVKPANLFFTREKLVKIMDFGLAKTVEEVRRGSTVIGGTPYYMAPEQAAGENVDARTDLYALGVTLFRMATGAVPFRDGDVAYHHRHTPPPDPRELASELPAAFAELVLELLAKRPDERPRDAAEVGSRLHALLRR